jgi:NAD(P)-dependent dehydrogenase (short-subunit alcohol dehydrogenase family)
VLLDLVQYKIEAGADVCGQSVAGALAPAVQQTHQGVEGLDILINNAALGCAPHGS